MAKDLQLELYTRATCSDCQLAKEYLADNKIDYLDKEVEKASEFEEELKALSGTRIVPFFAFYKKGLFGRRKLVHKFIGFDNNREEIVKLLKV